MTEQDTIDKAEDKSILGQAYVLYIESMLQGSGQKLHGYFAGIDLHDEGYSGIMCSKSLAEAKFYDTKGEAEKARHYLHYLNDTAYESSAVLLNIDVVPIRTH